VGGPVGGKLAGYAVGKAGSALSAVFKVGSGKGAKYVTKELTEAETAQLIKAVEKEALGKNPARSAEAKKALEQWAQGGGNVGKQAGQALDNLASAGKPSARFTHDRYVQQVRPGAREKVFATPWSEGKGFGSRRFDDFDFATGTAYEGNTTPWSE